MGRTVSSFNTVSPRRIGQIINEAWIRMVLTIPFHTPRVEGEADVYRGMILAGEQPLLPREHSLTSILLE